MAKAGTIFFKDDMYDGQLARTLSMAYVDAADLGEAFVAARAVGRTVPENWYAAWHELAVRVAATADRHDDPLSRAQALLRASEYHRQSYFFLRHDLADERLQRAFADHVASFRAALPGLTVAVDELAVPFEGHTLKAYVVASDRSGTPRPTILFPAGYDSTAESGWSDVRGPLERGFNVVTFEGPGQGASLYLDGLFFRPDYEVVVTAVLDAVLERPEVDPSALVLIGRSFGGYLAPRAAAYEHRLAALVCDPAQPDMAAHLPTGLVGDVAGPAARVMSAVSANRAEFFGSRMATHGLTRIEDYFAELKKFNMLDVASQIGCPTLIVEAEDDFAGGGGQVLADALTCPHDLVHLTAAEGAGGHCAGLGQRVWDGVVHDWLSRTLARLAPGR